MKKIKARVRFNASKENFEKFSDGMYFIYLPFEEDSDAVNVVKEILAKKLFASKAQISFMGKDAKGDWLFIIE